MLAYDHRYGNNLLANSINKISNRWIITHLIINKTQDENFSLSVTRYHPEPHPAFAQAVFNPAQVPITYNPQVARLLFQCFMLSSFVPCTDEIVKTFESKFLKVTHRFYFPNKPSSDTNYPPLHEYFLESPRSIQSPHASRRRIYNAVKQEFDSAYQSFCRIGNS